jgi:hypothetical protein
LPPPFAYIVIRRNEMDRAPAAAAEHICVPQSLNPAHSASGETPVQRSNYLNSASAGNDNQHTSSSKVCQRAADSQHREPRMAAVANGEYAAASASIQTKASAELWKIDAKQKARALKRERSCTSYR